MSVYDNVCAFMWCLELMHYGADEWTNPQLYLLGIALLSPSFCITFPTAVERIVFAVKNFRRLDLSMQN